MTLTELRNTGARYACKPTWNPLARLEMPDLVRVGGEAAFGPWCKLHDPYSDPKPINVLFVEANDELDDWEPCEGPVTKPCH